MIRTEQVHVIAIHYNILRVVIRTVPATAMQVDTVMTAEVMVGVAIVDIIIMVQVPHQTTHTTTVQETVFQ